MKKILCLHHTDLDGAGAAAVVGLYYQDSEVTYRPYNYGWPLSPKDLLGYDLVYAVDISFGQDHPWVYQIPDLIWIDHHKTALEYERDHPELHSIPGLRKIGVGACELTWEYLFPGHLTPNLILYLSTYDVWDKTRLDWDYVMKVETGAKYLLGISPQEIISFILDHGDITELEAVGRTILGYIEKTGRGRMMGGFWIPNFHGYRVMALNTPEFSSLSFLSHYNPKVADVCMPFQVVPGDGDLIVRVSLYTENPEVDVSEIAKLYGGGGHKGAAGMQISLEELKSILSGGVSLKKYFKSIGYKGNQPKYYI